MPAIDLGDVRLDCREGGTGELAVLVHGSASDRRTWDALFEASPHLRTFAYSRRHHWPHPPIAPDAEYAIAPHVDDLASLLGARGPAHVVGHSYGALVALLLAMRRPELVRTLVLVEPPALTLFTSDPPRPREILRLLFTRPRTAVAILRLGLGGLEPAAAAVRRGDHDAALRIFGTAVLGRDAFARLSPARLAQARANFIPNELVGSRLPALDRDALRELTVPVLLVDGARSPAVFRHFCDELARLLPNARRTTIADASHIVQEDAPRALAAALSAFVAEGIRQ